MKSHKNFGFHEFNIRSQDIDLTEAVEKGNFNIVASLILDQQASQIGTSKYGNFPLHIAAMNGDKEIFELLLNNGGDLSVVNDQFETPLHVAIKFKSFEVIIIIVNYSIDKKIKIDQFDMDNALLEAVAFEHYECAKLLIGIGAVSNDDIRNEQGTALENASRNDNVKILNLFLVDVIREGLEENNEQSLALALSLSKEGIREAEDIIRKLLANEGKKLELTIAEIQNATAVIQEFIRKTNANQVDVSENKIIQECKISFSAVALLFVSSKNQPDSSFHIFTNALLDKILQHLADVMNVAGAGFMNAATAVSGAIIVDRFIVDYGNLGFFSKTSEGNALADNLDKNRKDPRMIKGLVRNYLASDVKTPEVIALLEKHQYTEDAEISNFLPLMKEWNELIKNHPNNPALYYERGSFYQGKGMVKEAFLDYVKIFDIQFVQTSADYEKEFELERIHNKASQKLYTLLMSVTHPDQLDGIDKEDLSDAIDRIIITKQKYAVMEKCSSPNNALYNYLKHGNETFMGIIRTHRGEQIIEEMEEKLQNHINRYDNAVRFKSRL